jgi:heme-degrading monooxygenase HmoA
MSDNTGDTPATPVVARLWRGATRAEDADRYLDYLRETGLAEYASTPGHRSTLTLRRAREDRAEFLLITLWDSMDAVRAFAGADPERAVFYPEDDRYLVDRDDRVTHFDLVDHQP